ncbi:hypothetical protein QQF64_028422 [Cirrhinus molitorella]|uniref:Uncharacterized protein n=1 Tax=Cirrhinus molitorella TaxID=172907 RepID=A0ABR3N727_9TELE
MSGSVKKLDDQIIQAMKDSLWRSAFMYCTTDVQRSRPQEPPLVLPEQCCYASTSCSGFSPVDVGTNGSPDPLSPPPPTLAPSAAALSLHLNHQ